jgi:hypothetical protein
MRLPARHWSCALLLLVPCPLLAQGAPALADSTLRRPDSLSSLQGLTDGSIGYAPADSVEGPLLFLPGVGNSLRGISIRGAVPEATGATVDGIDVTPGTRGAWIALPTSAVSNAWVVTGPLSARTAAGRALQFELPTMTDSAGARLSYASDRLMGASSLGVNRFAAHGGLAGSNYRMFLAGTLMGQKSADFGTNARDIPVFAPVGSDTTVRFAATPDPQADTLTVDIPAWGVTRGDCDAFAGSSNFAIADNYGLNCTGDRVPGSAQSRYRVAASGQYDLNRTAKLGFLALKARTDLRLFDFSNALNPANRRGDQQLASVYAVTLSGQLGRNALPGAYRIGVSRQVNQQLNGPLTPAGELKTRDPAMGLMLSGLEFRWDFESFPVDSQLVTNVRLNRLDSRRSPYDLNNVDQYNLHDDYRDGPYGLLGLAESGGPVGLLALFREQRTTGFADLAWPVNRNSVFMLGGTVTRYNLSNYSHQLTSQILSDVYIEKPISLALYAEQRFTYDRFELSAGVRYDRFHSNADRPTTLDTLPFIPGTSTPNPDFGTYQQYPAISSYGTEGQTFSILGNALPLRSTIADEAHSAFSPRFRAVLRLGKGSVLRGSIAREARMPDLAQVFTGINSDLTLTTSQQVFGSDLAFERTWQEELGLRQRLGEHLALDLVGFHRSTDSVALPGLLNLRNPTRNNSPASIRTYVGVGSYGTQGVSASLNYATAVLGATLSYEFLDVDQDFENASWNAWSRPHTLSAVVQFRAPRELRTGFLARSELWAGFQVASGTSYLICRFSFDATLTLSDEACPPPSGIGGIASTYQRLPMRKVLDLRFSKALGDAAYAPRFFVDARNLLNFTNVVRAFRDSARVGIAREQLLQNDLGGLRDEAIENGVYDDATGEINLATPGVCASWITTQHDGGTPSCVALQRAEARYGNGDGVYTNDEQRSASNAAFDASYLVGLNGTPRRVRIGIELGI